MLLKVEKFLGIEAWQGYLRHPEIAAQRKTVNARLNTSVTAQVMQELPQVRVEQNHTPSNT